MDNDYTALFLGIKVWKMTKAKLFGAAAVLWAKDPVTGTITVREAFDFGTQQLSEASRSAWNDNVAVTKASPKWLLPPVLATDWYRPAGSDTNGAAPVPVAFGQTRRVDPAWELVLPKNLILYRSRSDSVRGPYLSTLPAAATLLDFRVDMKKYQEKIDLTLRPLLSGGRVALPL